VTEISQVNAVNQCRTDLGYIMSWKFSMEHPKTGTETALEACDYFVDEVIEASSIRGGNWFIPKVLCIS